MGNTSNPVGARLAKASKNERVYSTASATNQQTLEIPISLVATASPTGALISQGGYQQHNNMPPYLCINFGIATTGIFPPRY